MIKKLQKVAFDRGLSGRKKEEIRTGFLEVARLVGYILFEYNYIILFKLG